MRYYEIAGRERPCEQDDPRRSLSLYVADSEYADCVAVIHRHGGEVVGVTKVPVGGMTLQVHCLSVDAASELFASWLDQTYASQPPAHRAAANRVECGARPRVQGR